MKTIKGDIGNRKVFARIKRSVKTMQSGLRQGLTEIGKENSRHLKALIRNPPKTGITYGKHQASRAGEAPANETGRLLKSVHYKVYGWSKMEFGDGMFYGKTLELDLGRIGERPHVLRTVNEKSKDNFNSLRIAVNRAMNRRKKYK